MSLEYMVNTVLAAKGTYVSYPADVANVLPGTRYCHKTYRCSLSDLCAGDNENAAALLKSDESTRMTIECQ